MYRNPNTRKNGKIEVEPAEKEEIPLKTPDNTPKVIKQLEKTTKSTNEWLQQIFYALAIIGVMVFGILVKVLVGG